MNFSLSFLKEFVEVIVSVLKNAFDYGKLSNVKSLFNKTEENTKYLHIAFPNTVFNLIFLKNWYWKCIVVTDFSMLVYTEFAITVEIKYYIWYLRDFWISFNKL